MLSKIMNIQKVGKKYKFNDYRKEDFLWASLTIHKNKIKKTLNIIKKNILDVKKPYIACSGGKDSVVMLHLVQKVCKELKLKLIPVMFHNSGVEWAGVDYIFDKLRNINLIDELIIVRPKYDAIDIKKKQIRGYISSNKKDKILLFDPVNEFINKNKFDCAFVGLRKYESKGRLLNRCLRGTSYRKGELLNCTPIVDWDYKDIFAYTAIHGLPLHYIYSAPLLHLEHRGRIRLSWWLSTDHYHHGEISWVKINFPEVYTEMVKHIPEIRFLV